MKVLIRAQIPPKSFPQKWVLAQPSLLAYGARELSFPRLCLGPKSLPDTA